MVLITLILFLHQLPVFEISIVSSISESIPMTRFVVHLSKYLNFLWWELTVCKSQNNLVLLQFTAVCISTVLLAINHAAASINQCHFTCHLIVLAVFTLLQKNCSDHLKLSNLKFLIIPILSREFRFRH